MQSAPFEVDAKEEKWQKSAEMNSLKSISVWSSCSSIPILWRLFSLSHTQPWDGTQWVIRNIWTYWQRVRTKGTLFRFRDILIITLVWKAKSLLRARVFTKLIRCWCVVFKADIMKQFASFVRLCWSWHYASAPTVVANAAVFSCCSCWAAATAAAVFLCVDVSAGFCELHRRTVRTLCDWKLYVTDMPAIEYRFFSNIPQTPMCLLIAPFVFPAAMMTF